MDAKGSFLSLASSLNTSNKPKKARRADDKKPVPPVLVIHGGAGTMQPGTLPERQELYRAALKEALKAGYEVLSKGGEAIDAVTAAVSSLEDCYLFNAAHGAVFNLEGKQELDTSIMLSKPPISGSKVAIPPERRGISITVMTRVRNPVQLARALYLAPYAIPHTMMAGAYAEELGQKEGVKLVDPSYFYTEQRWRDHRRGLGLPEEPLPHGEKPDPDYKDPMDLSPKGTVGAVALDSRGCVACATSTGGSNNKLPGRIGDTPVMGSGFWAEEFEVGGWFRRLFKKTKKAMGVSCTGDGDFYIRRAAAATIARRMEYKGESLEKAARWVIEDLRFQGAMGGIIALDDSGNVTLPMNSPGMYRGVIREDGVPKVAIFDYEELA